MENSILDLLYAVCGFVFGLALVVLAISIYFVPSLIAFKRNHHYRWVIFAINSIGGLTVIGYLVAFVWAVWPRDTALADPFYGDPTSSDVNGGRKVYERRGEYQNATSKGEQWYFATGNNVQGPISRAELIQKVVVGEVTRTALVWREGMSGWLNVESAIPLPSHAT